MFNTKLKAVLTGGSLFFIFQSITAFALPSLQTAFVANYPKTRTTQLDACVTCHMPIEANFLNAYGNALRDAKMDFAKIEDQDSDGDGMSNIDEINELKFPGSQAPYPEYFIFTNGMGDVHFNHEMHVVEDSYLSKGRCANCHGNSALFAKKFDDNNSVQELAHQICWRCHKTSGSEHAPTACGDCHKKSF